MRTIYKHCVQFIGYLIKIIRNPQATFADNHTFKPRGEGHKYMGMSALTNDIWLEVYVKLRACCETTHYTELLMTKEI